MASPHLDPDDESPSLPAVPVAALLVASVLLYAFVPAGALFGLCGFGPGARAYTPGFLARLPVYFVLYTAAVHLFLVWPVAQLVFTDGNGGPVPFGVIPRWCIAVLLLSLPLSSFAYYLGSYRGGMDFAEMALTVLPAAAIAAVVFEVTRRTWLMTLVLAVTTFLPFFLLNDILGPFPVAWHYVPTGTGFYTLRIAFPPLALACAAWALLRAPGRERAEA